jgi:hypothetical protein
MISKNARHLLKSTPIMCFLMGLAIMLVALLPGVSCAVIKRLNHPPVLGSLTDKTVYQASLLAFVIHATDKDNDNLVFSAANLPPGATFDSSTQIFSFIPEAPGTFSDVTFSVTDGIESVSQSIHIQVLPVIPTLLKPPADGVVPFAINYYGDETPDVKTAMLNIRPQYLICDTANSLWGKIADEGSSIFTDISDYRAVGIKVIGYITTGYEGSQSNSRIDTKWYSLETNKQLIQEMAETDHVDGVFIDEVSSFPDEREKEYLKTLTDLAHSYGLITWGNVGTSDFDTWFFTDGGFDLMHSVEDWHAQNLNRIQLDWNYRISVTGFNKAYSAEDAFNLTVDSVLKGLAFCYISDNSQGYNQLPTWLGEYVRLLREYQLNPQGYKISMEGGNTVGIVVSAPVPSGAFNEYNFTLQIMKTTVTGLEGEQQVFCSATIDDFHNLLTPGTTLVGNLDHSPGWWVIKGLN